MNLGAGRVLYQDLTKINKSLSDDTFAGNPALTNTFDTLHKSGGALHVFGLLSPGGVHSHEDQIHALINAAADAGLARVYVHAFLDGRDTPPRSAMPSIEATDRLLDQRFGNAAQARIASITGRYYAMDRDNRWERVQPAYDLLTLGISDQRSETAAEGLKAAYAADLNDEFVTATAVVPSGAEPATVDDGDAVIFMNFRADRARELSRAFVSTNFDGFGRQKIPNLSQFVTLTQYAEDIPATVAFPPETPRNTLGEHLSNLDKTQLRIAETEKYAHVTFFFSGGRETPYDGEQRILVPSPDVATYDLKPEMSALEVTDELVKAIESGDFDAIICNYANGDMVGHTGVFDAAVKAVETLDACLSRLVAAVHKTGGHMLITADHGNVEKMKDHDTGQAHTAHTCEPVPLVYVGAGDVTLSDGGILADVAPTLLTLMRLPIPPEMTGRSLVAESAAAKQA